MPHVEDLQESGASERKQQSARYDNMAAYAHKLLTVGGKPRYSEASIRRSMAASRILNKDGSVNRERFARYMRSRGFDDGMKKGQHRKLPPQDTLDQIAEEGSP